MSDTYTAICKKCKTETDCIPNSEGKMICLGCCENGHWPKNSVQRAFVDGAKWWQYHQNGSTMFGSERDEAEAEAIRRYRNIKA